MSGSHNAQSTWDFLREINVQAESSHNRSVQMTRESSSVSIGEVSSHQHAEGESESHLESSSRTFHNPNHCHAVSYLFYQVNKVQTVRLTIPAGVLANSSRLPEAVSSFKAVEQQSNLNVNFARVNLASLAAVSTNQEPVSPTLSAQAATAVQADLKKQGIRDTKGKVSREIRAEVEFEFRTSQPTPGAVVKGCLDDCQTCEPALQEKIKLELEHKKLQNEFLKMRMICLRSLRSTVAVRPTRRRMRRRPPSGQTWQRRPQILDYPPGSAMLVVGSRIE
jgi:hypothetical protein